MFNGSHTQQQMVRILLSKNNQFISQLKANSLKIKNLRTGVPKCVGQIKRKHKNLWVLTSWNFTMRQKSKSSV